MFFKLLLMMVGGICVLGAVMMFAFPDIWEAARNFDWSLMAKAIVTHFGF